MKEVNKNRKEEILSHHTEVNIDEIWAAIEPQVDLINAEKKRKKRFIFFFLFGAILLASSGLYMWQNEKQGENINTTVNVNPETSNTNTKETSGHLKEKIANPNTKTQPTDNQSVKGKNAVITEEKIDISTPIKSANFANNHVLTKGKGKENSNSNKVTKISFYEESLIQQKDTNKKDVLLNEKTASTKRPFIQEDTKTKTLKPISPSPQIASLHLKLSTSIPDVGEVNIAEEDKENEDDKRFGRDLNFALAANTGISFINRGLDSNIEGENSSEILRLRRESETMLEAIHYGLRAKLTHKLGFSFSTGGQYTVLSERYDNTNLEIEIDSIEGIIKREIQINGDTVDILGMMPRTTTYDYEKQIYNRYKMIDIPFIVGYESGRDDWSLGIQAGVFVNLALKTSGQIRNTATEDINIGDNQADIFKSKLGLSYYGGIYIRRALSQNLDITVAPHGRFFMKDFNVDSYALKQKYSLIGVQAGLSYRF